VKTPLSKTHQKLVLNTTLLKEVKVVVRVKVKVEVVVPHPKVDLVRFVLNQIMMPPFASTGMMLILTYLVKVEVSMQDLQDQETPILT
jgi:hypothetical protein